MHSCPSSHFPLPRPRSAGDWQSDPAQFHPIPPPPCHPATSPPVHSQPKESAAMTVPLRQLLDCSPIRLPTAILSFPAPWSGPSSREIAARRPAFHPRDTCPATQDGQDVLAALLLSPRAAQSLHGAAHASLSHLGSRAGTWRRARTPSSRKPCCPTTSFASTQSGIQPMDLARRPKLDPTWPKPGRCCYCPHRHCAAAANGRCCCCDW